jgi:hypothetical protein
VLWVFGQELRDGNERKLLVFVTVVLISFRFASSRLLNVGLLVCLACSNLSLKMSLFIVEILKLKM